MKQVEKAVDIFETKYLHAHGHFVFDNAPSHNKIADNQLNECQSWWEATINERHN